MHAAHFHYSRKHNDYVSPITDNNIPEQPQLNGKLRRIVIIHDIYQFSSALLGYSKT